MAIPTAWPEPFRVPSTPSGVKKGEGTGCPLDVMNCPRPSTSGRPSPFESTNGGGTAPFRSGTAAYARGSRCTTYCVGVRPTSNAGSVWFMIWRVTSRFDRGRDSSTRPGTPGSLVVVSSGSGVGVAAVRSSCFSTASSCCICGAAGPGMGLRLPMPSGLDGSIAPAGLYGSESVASSDSSDRTIGTSCGSARMGRAVPRPIARGR